MTKNDPHREALRHSKDQTPAEARYKFYRMLNYLPQEALRMAEVEWA